MNFKQRRDRAHKAKMQERLTRKILRMYRWHLAEEVFQRDRIMAKYIGNHPRIPGGGKAFVAPMVYFSEVADPTIWPPIGPYIEVP